MNKIVNIKFSFLFVYDYEIYIKKRNGEVCFFTKLTNLLVFAWQFKKSVPRLRKMRQICVLCVQYS